MGMHMPMRHEHFSAKILSWLQCTIINWTYLCKLCTYPCHLNIVLNWNTEFKNYSSCTPHTLGGLGGGAGFLNFGFGGSGGLSSQFLCGTWGGLWRTTLGELSLHLTPIILHNHWSRLYVSNHFSVLVHLVVSWQAWVCLNQQNTHSPCSVMF